MEDHSQNLVRKFLQIESTFEFKNKSLHFINLGQIIKQDALMSFLPHNIKQDEMDQMDKT